MMTTHFALLYTLTGLMLTLLVAVGIDLTAEWYGVEFVNQMSLKEIFAYTVIIQLSTMKPPSFRAFRMALNEKENKKDETDLLLLMIYRLIIALSVVLVMSMVYLCQLFF